MHLDLKPQNILVEHGTGRVVLMDFGLARLEELAGKSADGVAGTPEYMAPEQARGREVDARADLYALGSVLYYLLTGEVAFRPAWPWPGAAPAGRQVPDHRWRVPLARRAARQARHRAVRRVAGERAPTRRRPGVTINEQRQPQSCLAVARRLRAVKSQFAESHERWRRAPACRSLG